ncbi:MAG TPA: hypothetical protein VFO65_11120, partial [Acidimicrobiales bacterium]|nr:hypothetical protein [Acidimicrobiales bacterium]
MEPIEFLKVLRRRWTIVAGTTVLAIVLALVTAPGGSSGSTGDPGSGGDGPAPTGYEATHTLVPYADPFGLTNYNRNQQNLEVMALYVKRGEVPKRAAAALGFEGDPAMLARQVISKVELQANSISISTIGPDPQAVVELTNTFATELLSYLTEQQGEQYQRALDDALARADALRAELQQVDTQLSRQEPPGDAVLRSQRDALARQYSTTFERYQQLNGQGAPPPPLMTAQTATPEPLIADESPVRVPSDRGGRSVVAALLGLMVGAGLAVGVDRLDTRLRTKEQFEKMLELPVLAEIPFLGRRRPAGLVTRQSPASPSAEAFRVLRASLPLLAKPAVGRGHAGAPQVFLVTSAASGDGKTTVVANLAASFAEAGRSV